MPIFDNELFNSSLNREPNIPQLSTQSPSTISLNKGLGGFGEQPVENTGLGLDAIAEVGKVPNINTWGSPVQMIPQSELIENKRYGMYERGMDLEQYHALGQHWYSQLGNSLVKMGATAVGTFAQTFGTIPNAISAIKNGSMSDFSDPDGYESSIDTWLKNLEDKFPNYYTNYQKEHPFLSAIQPTGMANFWGDKVFKNLGFTIGAISGAVVQDIAIGAATGGIGETPLIAGQIGKASLYLGKLFSRTDDVARVVNAARTAGVTGEGLLDVAKIAQIAKGGQFLDKAATGIRYGIGLYSSSAAEAGVEARDGYRQVKDELVKQYKIDHFGEEPDGQAIDEINKYAEGAMNTRFGINMALLTVSNAIQFDGFLRAFGKASDKALTREVGEIGKIGLKEGSLDVFEKKVAATIGGKVWDKVKPILPTLFAEGVYEEGGQYATERGTYDYYTRKYKDPKRKENVDNWNTLNETINSTVYGLKQQFGTDEGIENMVIGALTAVITGKATQILDNKRGVGKDAKLNATINNLNQYGLTGTLSQKYENTLNSTGILKEMDDAVKNNDVFKYKNLKHDMFFNFVTSRIPSGMHDVTIEQLEMLRELKKEDFEKTFGVDFNETSRNTVEGYVDALIQKANSIKDITIALDKTYRNPFKNSQNATTEEEIKENKYYNEFNKWKTDLAYYASIPNDLNSRLESINNDLIKIYPLLNTELVAQLTDDKSLRELSKEYESQANTLLKTINELSSPEDKRKINRDVKALRTLSEKINLDLLGDQINTRTFSNILNFELNGRDLTKENVVPIEKSVDIIKYGVDVNRANSLKKNIIAKYDALSSKEGFEKYFEQGDKVEEDKTIPVVEPKEFEFLNYKKEKEVAQVDREYELPTVKVAKVRKLADDRWQVTSPDGAKEFYDTEEKARNAEKDINLDLNNLSKIKIVALNSDGTFKIQDLQGNILNINSSELGGYKSVQTEEEKLTKNKSQLDKSQNEFLPFSGTVPTGNPEEDVKSFEEPRKTSEDFFSSTITESEQDTNISEAAPHIKKSRIFLNNFKTFKNKNKIGIIQVTPNQEEQYGLKGLSQFSFQTSDDSKEFNEKIRNIDTGFVASVFVEFDKGKIYFVDEQGKRISELGQQVDLNSIVFQTMPTTNVYYEYKDKQGNLVPRYRSGEREVFEEKAKVWREKREELFSHQGNPKVYKFNISRGIPISIEGENNAVGDVLIDKKKISSQQGLIEISKEGVISHNGKVYKFPKGRPVLKNDDTLEPLLNNKLGKERATNLFHVILTQVNKLIEANNNNEPLELNPTLISYIQGLLYYTDKKDVKSSNKFLIDTDVMTIIIGDTSYRFSQIEENKDRIIEQLTNTYHNINDKFLGEKKFGDTFRELVFNGSELKAKDWKNYQTYLLSSEGRTTNDIPLVISVAKTTEGVPYTHKAKYATVIDFEAPSVVTKKKEEPIIAPEPIVEKTVIVDKFTFNNVEGNWYDNKTLEGVFKIAAGETPFTASIDENNNVSVEATPSEELLLKLNKTAEEFATIISASIKLLRNKELKKQPEQKVEKKEEESIEDKKVDIEKRRQQELDNIPVGVGITATQATRIRSEKAREINKKYDAELAQLGIPKKGFDLKNTNLPTDDFRRVGKDSSEMMDNTEIELFKEWAKNNVPNIPYEILDNIISINNTEKAWGVFENGVAKFYKGGLRGTEYHEVFEGVFKGFLSPEQRVALLNEFKNKQGEFIDRQTGKKIEYSKATDLQAKERIADDFADFRLGKLPARNLGEQILRFFKNIIEFFKSFIRKPSLKEQLFKDINIGKFKEYTLPNNLEGSEYSRINGIPETIAFQYVQDMTIRASNYIFGEGKKALYNKKELIGKEVYNYVKSLYSGDENKYQVIENAGEGSFDLLWKRTKDNLRTMGITLDEENIIDINDGETNNKLFAPEAFTVDPKRTASFAIKFTTSTMPVVESNQKWNVGDLLPKRKFSEAKGYLINNFNRVFATLLDRMSNTTSIEKLEEKLLDLAKTDPNFVRLFQNVGGNLQTGTFSFNDFKNEDWKLFIDFFQTFTKQHPEAIIQYIDGDRVSIGAANQFDVIKNVKSDWIEQMKSLSKKTNSFITYNKFAKTYSVNFKNFPKELPSSGAEQVNFLQKLGIDFNLEIYTKLSKDKKTNEDSSQIDQFSKAVNKLHTYLKKIEGLETLKGKFLDVNQSLDTLAKLYVDVTAPNQENTFIGVDGEMHQSYTENNTISVLENEFNESETLEELLEKRPELNDVFSKNSVVLKQGGIFIDENGNRKKLLKLSHIQGTKNNDENKGTKTSKLYLADRFIQEINQNLKGNYYILVPADSNTEWIINFGNHISFSDVETEKAWDKVYDVFKGYLIDDINLALDFKNREILKNVGTKAKELRIFKDILNEKDLGVINTLIENESSIEEFEEYINKNIDSINTSVKEFIDNTIRETKDILIEGKKIALNNDGTFNYNSLIDDFAQDNNLNKNSLSENSVNNILSFVGINYVINNIELHKVIFGDPYQFAIKNNRLDETKRIKLFLSQKKTMFDTPEYNTFLNQNFNIIDGIELSPEDVGYHEHKSYTSTVTLKDVNIATDLYHKINEADAFSIVIDNTYREIQQKNNKWPDEAENWHQWQMAYTRRALDKKGIRKYTNEKLREHDNTLLSSSEPLYETSILKPLITGFDKNVNHIKLIGDKLSQMPIYYKAIEGKALEQLYIKMLNENKGYVIYESGRKFGAEQLHDVYKDGIFNEEPFNNNNIDVSWKDYGIILDTEHKGEQSQTLGSQLTKIATIDLFENGEPYTDNPLTKNRINKFYERYKKATSTLHQEKYERFLDKLGIEDMGQYFKVTDNSKIAETLEYEMLRRELSENAKDVLRLDENGQFSIPFEAAPNYKQIKDILYSLINKALISPKMNGGMHVQAPATLWENEKEGRNLVLKQKVGDKISYKKISREEFNSLSEEEKKNVRLTSSNLKFYTKEDPYCEILLPHWFKNEFDKKRFPTDESILNYLNSSEEGKKILSGIAFRIPTQALSSVEVFRVKGFLPQSMGDTVIVPSEITAKAGSDFDIDKLNMYLRNIYKDINGNVRLVDYKGEQTREFFDNIFSETIQKKIDRIENYEKFQNKLLDIFNKIESLPEINSEEMNKIFSEEDSEFYDDNIDVLQHIINDAADLEINPSDYLLKQLESSENIKEYLSAKYLSDKLRTEYVDKMYLKALENEYYESLEQLLTLPENFDKLITPIDDAGLEKDSVELDELTGNNEDTIKNRLLNRKYITTLRHAFVTGKKWVGIVAVNITGHSLTQKSKTYIDPNKFNKVKAFDRKFLGDGSIVLPHNIVDVDGQPRVSMSGVKTSDGKEFISHRLSGYATAVVDVAKDPYILKIITSDLVVSTFMFLERIGCGKNTNFFMNQPIIREYLKYLDSADSRSLYNKKNLEYIKSIFPVGKTDLQNIVINVENLKNNINKYYKELLTNEENAEQHKILDEFLKYSKMASFSFKLTQATNYDTTKFKDSDSFSLKNRRTDIAQETNIFSSPEDILKNNTIGIQKEYINSAMESMGSIFKLEEEKFKKITSDVMKEYEEREFITQDDFDRIATKVKSAFLDYIIQTKSGLNTRIFELLVSQDSVVNQLEKLKQKYPGMQLLKDLKIISSDRELGARTIKLNANIKDAPNQNLYTEMMRELKQLEPEFYKNLINLSILQGNYQTAITIKNIIPVEDYADIISPIINSLSPTQELQNFSQGMFQRNNWKDNNVFENFVPKFFESKYEEPVEDQFGNMYYKYTSPSFSTNKYFNIKDNDRKLLFLSEKYNSMQIDKDYLKVNRIVKISEDEYMDMRTGKTILKKTMAIKRAKGDQSLKEVYGYQKVKYSDGSPLITNTGNYVYKLINLWGNGQLASEYYSEFKPSVLDNGTVKIDTEIPDADLINYFAPKVAKKVVSSPEISKQTKINTVVNKSLSFGELKELVAKEKTVYTSRGIYTMRTSGNEHFGNPFTGSGVQGLKQAKDVPTAVQAYKEWLKDDYIIYEDNNGVVQEIEEGFKKEQRDWILSQIEQGKLDNKTLLYMKDKGEYYSHADALRDIVNSREISKQNINTPEGLPSIERSKLTC